MTKAKAAAKKVRKQAKEAMAELDGEEVSQKEFAITVATFLNGLRNADIGLTRNDGESVIVITHPEKRGTEALCGLLCILRDMRPA